MPDKYTTIRVSTLTRDEVKKLAEERKVSVDDLIASFLKNVKDTVKPILLYRDNEKFNRLLELAKILHQMNLIKEPKIEDVMQLAEDNLVKGMEKSLRAIQSVPNGQPTDVGTGQLKGVGQP